MLRPLSGSLLDCSSRDPFDVRVLSFLQWSQELVGQIVESPCEFATTPGEGGVAGECFRVSELDDIPLRRLAAYQRCHIQSSVD